MSPKRISHKRVLELLDDPDFHLAAAEYPDQWQDELDAVNDYLRSVTPQLPEAVLATAPLVLKFVGTRVKRIEDPARLTGQAIYVSDVKLPDMLHVAILRSPHAHARIEDIDTSAAEALPGVRAVLTYKNAPKTTIGGPPNKLAVNQEVHFAGEDVAAVAAEDMHTAREAIDLIKVTYKILPSITDLEATIAPGAPDLVGTGSNKASTSLAPVKRGSFDAAYAAAPIKHEGSFSTSTLQHSPLEPHVTVARWEGPDRLVLWSSSQYLPGLRNSVATYFGLPRSHVRVIAENVGGGFGSKGGAQRDSYIAALLAKMTQRPVRVQFDRPGNFKASVHRYATILRLKAGVGADGKMQAYYAYNLGDAGAYNSGASALTPIQRLYQVNNALFEQVTVISNRGPSGPQRCVGDPQGTWAQEIFMDELAEKVGMNPLDFRLKNFETKVDQDRSAPVSAVPAVAADPEFQSQQVGNKVPWASCGIVECVQKGAATIGWQQKWHKPGAQITGNKAHGIGMAAHACAHGSMSLPMTAFVRLDRDGSLDVNNSLTEIGGGQSTTMMIIAAETVGVKLSDAQPAWGDSGFLPDAGVTAGSRGTISVGNAMRNAALDLKWQILQQATKALAPNNQPLLPGAPEDLDTGDGYVFVKADPSKKVALKDVANSTGSPMLGRGTHTVPPGVGMSVFAAGFAEVEVDLDTGDVTLLRYVAANDVGKSVNTLGVEQQIEGGASMSIGFGLAEEMKFDPPGNFPVNWNWENYGMPTTLEHPKWADFTPIAVEPIDAIGPYGAKGVGEPPAAPPAPAIANAIYNAIGVRFHDAPITRDKVLAAITQMKRG